MAETLKAGRELDERVAIELFGWKWLAYLSVPARGTPGYPKKCRVRSLSSPEKVADERWQRYWAREGVDVADATGDEPHEYDGAFLPAYSTDISAAFSVVERMREKDFHFELTAFDELHGKTWDADFVLWDKNGNRLRRGNYECDSAPEAICRAALAAMAD
jgi:hypothetical protein